MNPIIEDLFQAVGTRDSATILKIFDAIHQSQSYDVLKQFLTLRNLHANFDNHKKTNLSEDGKPYDIDPHTPGIWLLRLAAQYGKYNILILIYRDLLKRINYDHDIDDGSIENETAGSYRDHAIGEVVKDIIKYVTADMDTIHFILRLYCAFVGPSEIIELISAYKLDHLMPDFLTESNFEDDGFFIGGNMLAYCIKKDHTKAVRFILKNLSIDPGANDNAALFAAYFNDKLGALQLLLHDNRVDPNSICDCVTLRDHPAALRILLRDPRVDLHKVQQAQGSIA
jgi:hypothetical protein